MAETLKSIETNLEIKDYWYEKFQDYQKSGLSKSAYARDHKISKSRFMYWSRKFELACSSSNQATRGDGFVAVKMKPELDRGLNPVLCSIGLGDYQLLIHDITALPAIMQLLR